MVIFPFGYNTFCDSVCLLHYWDHGFPLLVHKIRIFTDAKTAVRITHHDVSEYSNFMHK